MANACVSTGCIGLWDSRRGVCKNALVWYRPPPPALAVPRFGLGFLIEAWAGWCALNQYQPSIAFCFICVRFVHVCMCILNEYAYIYMHMAKMCSYLGV